MFLKTYKTCDSLELQILLFLHHITKIRKKIKIILVYIGGVFFGALVNFLW